MTITLYKDICIAIVKLLFDSNTLLRRPFDFCKIKFLWSLKRYENIRVYWLCISSESLITENYLTWSKTVENGCCTLLRREKYPLRTWRSWSNPSSVTFPFTNYKFSVNMSRYAVLILTWLNKKTAFRMALLSQPTIWRHKVQELSDVPTLSPCSIRYTRAHTLLSVVEQLQLHRIIHYINVVHIQIFCAVNPHLSPPTSDTINEAKRANSNVRCWNVYRVNEIP